MLSGAFKNMKPLSQLMFAIFVIIASFLAFLVVSLVIAIPVFGMENIINMQAIADLNNPENLIVLKYFQVVQSIGVFIVPPFILALLYNGEITDYLKLDKKTTLTSALLVLLLSFAASPFVNFIGELNSNMQLPSWLSGVEEWMKSAEDKAAQLTEAFLKVDGLGGLVFNLFMIAFLAAVGEELLFRGVIQQIFTNWTRSFHWGIWISAFLFSALHMQFYGFIPRLLLGVLFGYLLVWSGSMWLPMLAHFINNAVAVIGLYMMDHGLIGRDIEEIGTAADRQYLALISVVLIAVLLWMIRQQSLVPKVRNNEMIG